MHIRDREAESTTYPTNLVVIKSGEKIGCFNYTRDKMEQNFVIGLGTTIQIGPNTLIKLNKSVSNDMLQMF